MAIETSGDRFERVLKFFKKELVKNPRVSMKECCTHNHTNYKSMETWLRRHHVSIKELRGEVQKELKEESGIGSEQSFSGFIALTPPKEVPSEEMLQSVSVTFPDGTIVSIRKCTPWGLTTFIKNYIWDGEEVKSCSR